MKPTDPIARVLHLALERGICFSPGLEELCVGRLGPPTIADALVQLPSPEKAPNIEWPPGVHAYDVIAARIERLVDGESAWNISEAFEYLGLDEWSEDVMLGSDELAAICPLEFTG
jgi:hypothetical protein